jgi:hypothetical protein
MKINELRIGDWYKSVKFGDAVKCDLSDLYDLCAKSDGAYNDPPIDEMFEPIPLTEEWLLKFGFEKILKYYALGIHQELFSGLMKFRFDRLLQKWIFSIGTYKDITRVKYVHQLQNLYFALTGNELTIEK